MELGKLNKAILNPKIQYIAIIESEEFFKYALLQTCLYRRVSWF